MGMATHRKIPPNPYSGKKETENIEEKQRKYNGKVSLVQE
jgi:hypothetical protein